MFTSFKFVFNEMGIFRRAEVFFYSIVYIELLQTRDKTDQKN